MALREIATNGTSLAPRQLIQPSERNSVPSPQKVNEKWSDSELKALVEFVLFYNTGENWPGHKQTEFWSSASTFVSSRSGVATERSVVCIHSR